MLFQLISRISHNNALESTNRYIKENGLDRSRLVILQFLNLSRDNVVKQWSTDRNEVTNINHKKYELEPIFELKDWTNAFKWNLLRKEVVKINSQAFTRSSSGGTSLSKEQVKQHFSILNSLDFDNFDKFIIMVHSIWVVKVCQANWKLSTCTCPTYMKDYKCKHMIAICVRLGLVEYPATAMTLPLQQKRKRGRPQATRGALTRQPCEVQENTPPLPQAQQLQIRHTPISTSQSSILISLSQSNKRQPLIETEGDNLVRTQNRARYSPFKARVQPTRQVKK
jgi:hypothetical protein